MYQYKKVIQIGKIGLPVLAHVKLCTLHGQMIHTSCCVDIVPDRGVRVGRGWTALVGCEAAGRGSWPQDSSHPPRATADDAAAMRERKF